LLLDRRKIPCNVGITDLPYGGEVQRRAIDFKVVRKRDFYNLWVYLRNILGIPCRIHQLIIDLYILFNKKFVLHNIVVFPTLTFQEIINELGNLSTCYTWTNCPVLPPAIRYREWFLPHGNTELVDDYVLAAAEVKTLLQFISRV